MRSRRNGRALLPAILQSPRALVYISVPWAGTERASRVSYVQAVVRMEAEVEKRRIRCFFLHVDECPVSEEWIQSLPRFPGLVFGGNGEVLWLESGEIVAAISHLGRNRESAVIEQTMSIWNRSS